MFKNWIEVIIDHFQEELVFNKESSLSYVSRLCPFDSSQQGVHLNIGTDV